MMAALRGLMERGLEGDKAGSAGAQAALRGTVTHGAREMRVHSDGRGQAFKTQQ